MSTRPPTLEYRRVQPARVAGGTFHLRGALVVLGLVAVVVMLNVVLLILLTL